MPKSNRERFPLGEAQGHDDTRGAEAKLRKFLKQGAEILCVSALADVQALLGDGGGKGGCYVVDHLTKLHLGSQGDLLSEINDFRRMIRWCSPQVKRLDCRATGEPRGYPGHFPRWLCTSTTA